MDSPEPCRQVLGYDVTWHSEVEQIVDDGNGQRKIKYAVGTINRFGQEEVIYHKLPGSNPI